MRKKRRQTAHTSIQLDHEDGPDILLPEVANAKSQLRKRANSQYGRDSC